MDPYKILNVPKDASDSEIKKAYRKLAAKHHPDKSGDDTIFKQVNEAYSTIRTQEKRQQHETSQNFRGFGGLGDLKDIFESFFGSRGQPRRQAREQTDDEIVFDFKISLSQIKKGFSQNIVFKRNKKCTACDGEGGKNKKICGACSGQGVQIIRRGSMIQQITCHSCLGGGLSYDEGCAKCRGSGMTQVTENINFTIENR